VTPEAQIIAGSDSKVQELLKRFKNSSKFMKKIR